MHTTEVGDSTKSDADEFDDQSCGCSITCFCFKIKRCRYKPLQRFATAKWTLVLFCFAHMLQQTVISGLLSMCISTLEKRFELQSTESGIIASTFDAVSVLTLILISFYGDNVHKPHWIGWGVFISGIGSIMFILPHFLAPAYSFEKSDTYNYCGNVTEIECHKSNLRDYRFLFIAAIGVFGIGANSLYTHAITYLDENVSKEQSSLYNGIYYAMGGLGPAVGYLCGGAALELYTDITVDTRELGIHSGDYSWIGAWWLGFLVCGIVLISTAIPLLMLPRQLPGTNECRINRNLEVQKNMLNGRNEKEDLKSGKLSDIMMLMKNKPFIFISLGATVNCAFVFGFNTFGAKYIESTFGLTAFLSSIVYGSSAIFASMGGQIIGGVVITRFSLSVKGILKFMIWCGVISTLCSLGFFVHCPDIDFAGATVPYSNETPPYSPLTFCNQECGCSLDHYKPICDNNGITYFSPCHAGCVVRINETAYSGCKCMVNSSEYELTDVVKSCFSESCNAIYPFVFVVFFCFFSSILTFPPSIQVTLRCVPFKARTLAMAVQRAIILAVGVVPGRIITGLVLDLACVSWSTECGEKGSCRAYKRGELSLNATLLLLIQTAVCVVFYILVYITYTPAPELIDNEDEMIEIFQDDSDRKVEREVKE